MTNATTTAALILYFQREATTRQLEAIDATLRSPTTPQHPREAAADAKAKAFATWTLQARRFDLAYLTLCQAGLAPEFWAALSCHCPDSLRR